MIAMIFMLVKCSDLRQGFISKFTVPCAPIKLAYMPLPTDSDPSANSVLKPRYDSLTYIKSLIR